MRIIRRGTGPLVTWRRAQMVLLSAQGMDVAAIAKVAFASEDRVRDVLRNFCAGEFGPLNLQPGPGRQWAAVSGKNKEPGRGQRRPGRGMGTGEQRRDRLHAFEFVLVNRIEAQFTALRYFALDGTGHATRQEQGSMIRRYMIWRNNHAYDERLRRVVARANVA